MAGHHGGRRRAAQPDEREYKSGRREYLAQGAAGLVAWSPLNDLEAEADALRTPVDEATTNAFVGRLHEAPVVLVVFADLAAPAAADRDRYTFAGGASVYPFVWTDRTGRTINRQPPGATSAIRI